MAWKGTVMAGAPPSCLDQTGGKVPGGRKAPKCLAMHRIAEIVDAGGWGLGVRRGAMRLTEYIMHFLTSQRPGHQQRCLH